MASVPKPKRILIAAGGTGGHVFPGLALADALRAHWSCDVVFVGTPRGIESKVIPAHGYRLELLNVEPMKGGGVARALRGGSIAAWQSLRAMALVARERPAAFVSIGGYAAGPIGVASVAAFVPLALVEPNGHPGLTNRLLAPFADRIFVAWPHLQSLGREGRARVDGVPLRAAFRPRPVERHEGLRVLVLGGSQGAKALNERVPDAVGRLGLMRDKLQVVHQCGKNAEQVEAAYRQAGFSSVQVVPFIDDVAGAIANADLVVGRAGAVSVAEVCAIGRPSILIPFPHAADDHQAANALALQEAGGAICIREEAADPVRLAVELERLLADHDRLRSMGKAALDAGRPDAAQVIAREVAALAKLDEVKG
jgi:UDP-N-acetylglucosamine--N-acetylmuramyl-(pentapeptide) pyrophosphoryl-undecaprenol N-acetylglucosamine transferase